MRDEYQLGTPVSMNQFYGKNGLPGSGVIRFSDFYGKSNFLDQQILTIGKFVPTNRYDAYGFMQSKGGSMSDGTANMFGGATFAHLCVQYAGTHYLYFGVNGVFGNTGWERMNVNGTDYYRSAANVGGFGGPNITSWFWDLGPSFNPIGTGIGNQVTITWWP